MYRKIAMSVPKKHAKTLLEFIFFMDKDVINEIDFTNTRTIGKSSNNLSVLNYTATMQNLEPFEILGRLYGVNLIRHRRSGYQIVPPLDYKLIGKSSDITNYWLEIVFCIHASHDCTVLTRPNSPMTIDLANRLWRCENDKGPISMRDNNIPNEIQGKGFNASQLINGNRTEDDAHNLKLHLLIATLINPTFPTDLIEFDLIGHSRKICLENKILTEDDLEFINSEVSFITGGVSHDVKY